MIDNFEEEIRMFCKITDPRKEERKMKNTKGPWIYEESTKTIRSIPENYWLATMDSWDGAINNNVNAHLIAAAPDLFEACKEALDIINAYSHIPAQFKACQILQDAINKAEGRKRTW